MTDKPMTKTEARAFIKRAREALSDLDGMLTKGGTAADWEETCNEAMGSIAHIQAATDANLGSGLTGVTP